MLTIGVCTENAQLRPELEEMLRHFLNASTLEAQLCVFPSFEELEAGVVPLDVLLLDTDTEAKEFQASARQLHQNNPGCCIMLLGHTAENAVFGY